MVTQPNDNAKNKQLLKILIGAAWLDGTIQSEERAYLHQKARECELENEPEIKTLLSEIKPIKPQECKELIEVYLGENHTHSDYEELLEALAAIIYSDGDVQSEEAIFLSEIQALDPDHESPKSGLDKVLKAVQNLYRKAVSEKK